MTNQEQNNDRLTVSLRSYVDLQIASLRAIHDRDIEANRVAVHVANRVLEARLEKLNEMRELLTDRETHYCTKGEMAIRLERFEEDIRDLRESRAEMHGKASQNSVFVAYILSIAGFVLGFFHLIIGFLGGK